MVGPWRSATSEPRDAGPDRAGPRLVALEHVMQQGRAPRLGEQLGAEADEAASRHEVVEAHPARAVVDDLLHAALAQREELGEHAHELLGDVDREPVDRLVHRPVDQRG